MENTNNDNPVSNVPEPKKEDLKKPEPAVEGYVVVSCTCGKAKTFTVEDIKAPVDWTCPRKDCKGQVSVTGRTKKLA